MSSDNEEKETSRREKKAPHISKRTPRKKLSLEEIAEEMRKRKPSFFASLSQIPASAFAGSAKNTTSPSSTATIPAHPHESSSSAASEAALQIIDQQIAAMREAWKSTK
jgi:hypothetical protein